MTAGISVRKIGIAAVAAASSLIATSAGAHHSFAMFDMAKEVTLQGTVREFQWTNPHTWVQLTVVENGKPVEYSIEGQSPNGLARRGWKKSSLKPGDRVTVAMNPLKDGGKGGSFKKATFPDGRVLTF